ncbi:GNAT family N-acetyltransferase [Azospirillum sp. SYSU D00513]|uniref:GNAT family N-acetyltransferase n=1 Tax=Azospirillum sp. SYSU D00513 TaxID=2812561 RepID=UPI001A97AD97|nr:GNAT family N-acetyltransferase [Azospirillum sp. SYSU D00513]
MATTQTISTPPTTQVRALESADRGSWLPLWRGYQAFYKVEIPEQTTEVTWNRLLDPREPVFGALALVDGEPAGMVHWIMHRSCWTTGDYCYLQDLFVAPDRRGAGLGRTLIEHVYAEARAAGCARVYWLTHETNTDAMQLYDRIADRSGFLQYRKMLG